MATANLLYGRKHQKGVNWITAIAMTAFHVGAVAAFFFIDYGAMLTAFAAVGRRRQLGIGMGYHRLLTHRGYKTPKWVEYFLTALRHARARRRTDLLGGHAPHPPSALRSRRRSAHAARRHLLGAHGLDPHAARGCTTTPRCWRATRPTSPDRFHVVAVHLALGAATWSSASRCSPSAACPTCCGASSSAPPSACTAPGW